MSIQFSKQELRDSKFPKENFQKLPKYQIVFVLGNSLNVSISIIIANVVLGLASEMYDGEII